MLHDRLQFDRQVSAAGPFVRPGDGRAASAAVAPGLTIRLSRGTGEGSTGLAAFDAALRSAGVANFNLVRLSSVIPPASVVRSVGSAEQLRGGWGDRLYCVYAEQRAMTPGEQAWAGVGWVLREDGCGAGLFVEHEGPTEAGVRGQIGASLTDMTAGRPDEFGPVQMQLAGAVCGDRPVCAVVIASYYAQAWPGTVPLSPAP